MPAHIHNEFTHGVSYTFFMLNTHYDDTDCEPSIEAITQTFADLNSLSGRNVTSADDVQIACYCLPVDDEDEEENEAHHAAMITLLIVVHEIHDHEKVKAFPLVLTKQCDGIDSETGHDTEKTLQHCIKN